MRLKIQLIGHPALKIKEFAKFSHKMLNFRTYSIVFLFNTIFFDLRTKF